MTLTQTADTRDAARLTDREAHQAALDALIGPVEESFVEAMRRVLRQVFARVNPGLVAAAHLDLTQLATLPDAWRNEIPGLSARVSELYGTGNLTAWLTNAGSYAQAQAAAARAGAPLLPALANERALGYMAVAENRLVRVAEPVWVVVQGQLHDGMMAGESIEQLAARVGQSFESGEARARTIARTESIGALNTGTMDGVRALGDFGPAFKTWLATDDERTRDDHFEMNGQTVPVDEPFIVGLDAEELDYPGDPNGSPGQIINCRCVATYGDTGPDGEVAPDTTSDQPDQLAEDQVIQDPERTPGQIAVDALMSGHTDFAARAAEEVSGIGSRAQRARHLEELATRNGRVADDEIMRRLDERGVRSVEEIDRTIAGYRADYDQSVADRGAVRERLTEEAKNRGLSDLEARLDAIEAAKTDPESAALMRRQSELIEQIKTASGEAQRARDAFQQEVVQLLGQVRGVGGAELELTGSANAREIASVAERVYPTDWIQASSDRGAVEVKVSPDRSYYIDHGADGYAHVLNTNDPRSEQVAVHEMAHRMEYSNPEIPPLERAFLERRAGDEDKLALKAMFPDAGYKDWEVTYQDEFASPYMGKDYAGLPGLAQSGFESPHELLSMGAEGLLSPSVADYSWSEWVHQLAADTDYRQWLLGVMFSV